MEITLTEEHDTIFVTCNATGGTLNTSSFTGPGVNSDLQPVGSIGRTGQNTYRAVYEANVTTASIGDEYYCNGSNEVSTSFVYFDLKGIHKYS